MKIGRRLAVSPVVMSTARVVNFTEDRGGFRTTARCRSAGCALARCHEAPNERSHIAWAHDWQGGSFSR